MLPSFRIVTYRSTSYEPRNENAIRYFFFVIGQEKYDELLSTMRKNAKKYSKMFLINYAFKRK